MVILGAVGLITIFNKVESYISNKSDEKFIHELEQKLELQNARDNYIINKATEQSVKTILEILEIDEERYYEQ